MTTKHSMTEEQEALLYKISINKQRIKEGILFVWQEEVLRQYDYVLDYLKGKYPFQTFHIIDCEPRNKLTNSYSKFVFQEAQDIKNDYKVYLYVEDGQYWAEDDFYGYTIGNEYDNKLMEILLQQNIF